MAQRLTAGYCNTYGKAEVNGNQNINFRQTIRVIKNGNLTKERCPKCSGFSFRNKKIQPTLQEVGKFQHKKGCELA